MAAAAALNMVKQIEGLADAPPTPQMRDCLGQLVSSLQFFFDHPDSRVRIGAARTLLKLSKGYGEDVRKLDLTKGRSCLAQCRAAAKEEGGVASEDAAELLRLLAETLEQGDAERSAQPASAGAASQAASATAEPVVAASAASSSKDTRGEVVLKMADPTDDTRATILAKVVSIAGVVSVAVEGPHVIVTTRTVEDAADPGFVKDLLGALSDQGVVGVTVGQASPSSPTRAGSSADAAPGAQSAATAAATPAEGELDEQEPSFLDDDEGPEPAYLDDEEDATGPVQTAGGIGGAPLTVGVGPNAQWSFFSQSNWMTGRRMQEFDDDPTIAARLAKAKQRQEERRKEEESKIGRVGRWLGWGK